MPIGIGSSLAIVGERLWPLPKLAEEVLTQPTQVEGCLSHLIRQRRTLELNALVDVNLRLPIERQVTCTSRPQSLDDGAFGRQSSGLGPAPACGRLRKHGRRI